MRRDPSRLLERGGEGSPSGGLLGVAGDVQPRAFFPDADVQGGANFYNYDIFKCNYINSKSSG